MNRDSKPLIVDLDGTLLRTDLLVETANALFSKHPFQCWRPFGWLLKGGKAHLKARLAHAAECDVANLPYNQKVLAWLASEKAVGRKLVLATASHKSLADAVARYLGIFDDVIATDGTNDLKSAAKRDALVVRYGPRGFDYAGNDSSDLLVWAASNRAWLVEPSAGLEAQAREVANIGGVIQGTLIGRLELLAKALRVHQWLKNLLVFIPLITAHRLASMEHVQAAVLAFICFSICASSVYLVNDLLDVREDRQHPRKRERPFASGQLSLLTGWALAPILLVCAFTAALLLLPLEFVGSLGAYYSLTLAYSFLLKKIAMLDVVTLALLYTLRLIAGAAAIAVPMSFWLLSFAMFIFTSLALVKRYTELVVAGEKGAHSRMWGRGYYSDDRDMVASLGASAGYLSVMVLALYIQDPATTALYRHPQIIWPACPLLLYWVSRAWLITRRGQMHDDPVIFAVKDRVSLLVAILFVAVFAMAR